MDKKEKDGFNINVYSPGNFIAQDITFTGTVNIGGGNTEAGGYTDEQIAQAITAINGEGKPLNSKQKWAAVYWCLRWYCNFPINTMDFCERIKQLPLRDLDYECDYNNIRRFTIYNFMSENARYMDKITPSNTESDFFNKCREVVSALVIELGKAALPKVEI